MVEIPTNAADLSPPSETARRGELERLEFELLETDRALRNLQKREAGQRYWLRWIAVLTGILVIGGMAAVLTHLVHNTFFGRVSCTFWAPLQCTFKGQLHVANGAFLVAMIVAPITSITAITVTLFVGAFRKFEEKDLETLGNGAVGAFNTLRGN